MKKIAGRLIGSAQHFPFAQRIFHFTMLLSIALTIIGALMDIYYGQNLLIDLLFTGIWMLVYFFSRFKGYFRAASIIGFIVLILLFFPYEWIMNGGISGGISYYAVIIPVIICVVLSGRLRILMLSAMFVSTLLLIVLDAFRTGSAGIVINLAV
jgi:hypothetical protein